MTTWDCEWTLVDDDRLTAPTSADSTNRSTENHEVAAEVTETLDAALAENERLTIEIERMKQELDRATSQGSVAAPAATPRTPSAPPPLDPFVADGPRLRADGLWCVSCVICDAGQSADFRELRCGGHAPCHNRSVPRVLRYARFPTEARGGRGGALAESEETLVCVCNTCGYAKPATHRALPFRHGITRFDATRPVPAAQPRFRTRRSQATWPLPILSSACAHPASLLRMRNPSGEPAERPDTEN